MSFCEAHAAFFFHYYLPLPIDVTFLEWLLNKRFDGSTFRSILNSPIGGVSIEYIVDFIMTNMHIKKKYVRTKQQP